MKHIDLLNNHYKSRLGVRVENGFPDLKIEHIIVGNYPDDYVDHLVVMLKSIYEKYFTSNKIMGIETISNFYVLYISGNSIKDRYLKATENNFNKLLQLLKNEKVQNITISMCRANETFYEATPFIALEFDNYKNSSNENYDSYKIKLSFLLKVYSTYGNQEKLGIESFWKSFFAKLNATTLIISHHDDFNEFTKSSKFKYISQPSKYILGCYWCNMLSKGHLEKLGGIENVKKQLIHFILEEHIQQNEDIALLIKLGNKFENMTQEDLMVLKGVLLPCLLPVDRTDNIERMKLAINKSEQNSPAYTATLSALNHEKFINRYVLLNEENSYK